MKQPFGDLATTQGLDQFELDLKKLEVLEKVGSGVTSWNEGDAAVMIALQTHHDDADSYCRSGLPPLSSRRRVQGLHLDGGMAEVGAAYVSGPTRVQFENKDPRGYDAFVKRFHEHSALGAANTFLGVQGRRPSVFELEDGLKKMIVPCHIMTGDEDEPCLEPNLWLKRTIPSAWLSVLPQSGHAINLEEPMLFNQLTAEFFRSVESGQFRNRDPRSVGRSIAGVR